MFKSLKNKENEDNKRSLNDKEKLFIANYCQFLRKDLAAKAAGHTGHTAKEVGFEIYNRPHVRAAINEFLKEKRVSAEEVIEGIAAIANFNLADYFIPEVTFKSKRFRAPLKQLIKDLQIRIEELDDFYLSAKELTEGEIKEIRSSIKSHERQIVRYQVRLKRDPKATEIVHGPEEEVTTWVLDINAVVADKEKGIIKSVKYTENGIQIEGYSALDAKRELAKMNGSYELDNKQKAPVINNNLSLERVREIANKLEDAV